MNALIKNIAQSLLQDGATAVSGYFAAHGLITNDQQQGLIGSLVFIGLLIVNATLQHVQTKQGA